MLKRECLYPEVVVLEWCEGEFVGPQGNGALIDREGGTRVQTGEQSTGRSDVLVSEAGLCEVIEVIV